MMTVHQTFDEGATDSDQNPHAIVVGAGFGGLAAAVRLSAAGFRVTVLERLDQAGGRARRFKIDGFTFDAGPTIITAPFVFEELWALCGRQLAQDVDLVSLDPFYTVRFADGSTFKASAIEEHMNAEIAKFSAEDVEGYRKYLIESEKCFQTGFIGMIDNSYATIKAMAGAMPGLIRRRAERSVYALVCKYIRSEKIRMALSFHPLFIGGNPMRASGVLSLISYLEREYGVHYAMGGTHALIEGLCGLIASQGGTVRTSAGVKEILLKDNKVSGVMLENGEQLQAQIVVSNADTGWTYKNLLPARNRKRWTNKKIDRSKHSMSLFVWYFGTDRTYDDVDHHTILMGPRYAALLTDIFDNKVLADDFSLYLYRPTATDPSMAPDGCDSFYVLSPVPNLEGDVDWSIESQRYRRKISDFLSSTILPDLEAHVVASKLMTPNDFQTELLSEKGAAFGMEPILTQLAWFRPHNISEEVENLFIVGAGTHPGAGLPGVVSSAKILDKVVPHVSHYK